MALGRQLPAGGGVLARRGSTQSPGTRSSTAGARSASPGRAGRRSGEGSGALLSAPSRAGRRGACRALAELPEHERRLIELAYWGELSQSEIAQFLGVPLGTVKTRTRSALARLADVLEGELS